MHCFATCVGPWTCWMTSFWRFVRRVFGIFLPIWNTVGLQQQRQVGFYLQWDLQSLWWALDLWTRYWLAIASNAQQTLCWQRSKRRFFLSSRWCSCTTSFWMALLRILTGLHQATCYWLYMVVAGILPFKMSRMWRMITPCFGGWWFLLCALHWRCIQQAWFGSQAQDRWSNFETTKQVWWTMSTWVDFVRKS